jgi:hypothetical protein
LWLANESEKKVAETDFFWERFQVWIIENKWPSNLALEQEKQKGKGSGAQMKSLMSHGGLRFYHIHTASFEAWFDIHLLSPPYIKALSSLVPSFI